MKQPDLAQLKETYQYKRLMERKNGTEANFLEKCIMCRQTKMRSTCVGCEFVV